MATDLTKFKAEGSIASLTPTVARLFSTAAPSLTREPPLDAVVEMHECAHRGDSVDRCLIFCPDALGVHIWRACENHLGAIGDLAPLPVQLCSVLPPKTPVCFASMFTGGQPRDHGITKYERPVLTCETLFDVLLRANKKIAIVAVADSSVDLIFRDRDMDYFSEPYDREVLDRAVAVLNENRHDLVIVYQQEYDDLLHETEPFSSVCIQAVENHVSSFITVARVASEAWSGQNSAIVFASDHGAHIDPQTGHGDHGENIPEDMELLHWYGMNAVETGLQNRCGQADTG